MLQRHSVPSTQPSVTVYQDNAELSSLSSKDTKYHMWSLLRLSFKIFLGLSFSTFVAFFLLQLFAVPSISRHSPCPSSSSELLRDSFSSSLECCPCPRKDSKPHYDLVIGILTAPQFYEKRMAMRQTWIAQLPPLTQSNRIKYFFFMGGNMTTSQTWAIEQEQKIYEDIVLFPDVGNSYGYDSLDKMLNFFRYSIKNFDFTYLLKLDDDIWITPDGWLNETDSLPKEMLYYGFLLVNWDVQRGGKYFEPEYARNTYPPYVQGHATLLTHDLVEWIQAIPNPHRYRMEDAAIGIWLETINITYKHTDKFHAWERCLPNAIAEEVDSPQAMLEFHERRLEGLPCRPPGWKENQPGSFADINELHDSGPHKTRKLQSYTASSSDPQAPQNENSASTSSSSFPESAEELVTDYDSSIPASQSQSLPSLASSQPSSELSFSPTSLPSTQIQSHPSRPKPYSESYPPHPRYKRNRNKIIRPPSHNHYRIQEGDDDGRSSASPSPSQDHYHYHRYRHYPRSRVTRQPSNGQEHFEHLVYRHNHRRHTYTDDEYIDDREEEAEEGSESRHMEERSRIQRESEGFDLDDGYYQGSEASNWDGSNVENFDEMENGF